MLMLGGLVVTAWSSGSQGDGAGAAGCPPEGTQTLIRNDVAVVYRKPTRDQARQFDVLGCAFSRPERHAILDQPPTSFLFLPPALSLSGTVVGYGELVCGGEEEGCFTLVAAGDLARDGAPVGNSIGGMSADPRRSPVKVGSLRVRGNGSMAWITCPEREFADTDPIPGSRRPNCVRKGSFDRVYKVEAPSRRPRLLDQGRDIDPSSLRRSGSRISWVSGGKRRRATLR